MRMSTISSVVPVSLPSAFAESALSQPIFVGDLDALRHKLANPTGLLGEQWRLFNDFFLPQPELRGGMIALPALLSGEWVDEARNQVLDFHRNMAQRDLDFAIQFHTWCYCGTALRNAAFFDGLSYRDAWSNSEIDELAETILRFGWKHPYAVSMGRGRSSNNQIWSMTLYCTVVGFLFGHKHAQHPTGKFLFEYGLKRLPDILGLFPADGYGGEGSTYTSHVNTPLACWTAIFLEQLTGHTWLDTHFAPNGTTSPQPPRYGGAHASSRGTSAVVGPLWLAVGGQWCAICVPGRSNSRLTVPFTDTVTHGFARSRLSRMGQRRSNVDCDLGGQSSLRPIPIAKSHNRWLVSSPHRRGTR